MKISSKAFHDKVRTLDWGPREFGTHKASDVGSIMSIAEKDFTTLQRENSIKHAADLMAEKHTRRIYITDPDGKLRGVVTAKDVVNFLGGGEKSKIIKEKHQGNLLSAVNEPVRQIMTEGVKSLKKTDSIEGAIKLMQESGVGGLPVLDEGKLVAVVTERHFAYLIAKGFSDEPVSDHMSGEVIFGTIGMQIADATKVMIRNGFRKLPILSERSLDGIITARDIVAAFSKDFSSEFLRARIDKLVKKPITITSNRTLIDAAEVMRENDIGGLPVMEGDKVVGIFTERDLIHTLK